MESRQILNLKKIGSEGMLKACCMEGAGEMWLSWCMQINDGTRAFMCCQFGGLFIAWKEEKNKIKNFA